MYLYACLCISVYELYNSYCCHGKQLGVDGEDHIRVGKLNLVDLAGSERQSKTGTTVRSCDYQQNGYTIVTLLGRTFQGGYQDKPITLCPGECYIISGKLTVHVCYLSCHCHPP